jgi:hypothetical protein
VELEMFKNIQPNFSKSRQLGDTFARTQSAEALLSYPHLIDWTARALVNPNHRKMDVMGDVVRELGTKARLYRDLGRIARRKRMLGHSWDAWAGEPDQRRTAAADNGYVPVAVPQRSDLLADEGEVNRPERKVKETVA